MPITWGELEGDLPCLFGTILTYQISAVADDDPLGPPSDDRVVRGRALRRRCPQA
jgi:hypothetical protein